MAGGERLVVGLVRGLHGLKGGVRVEVLTDRPEDRFAPGVVLHREGDERPLTVASSGPDSPGWLIRFEEIGDRTAAERLRGRYLEVVAEPDEGLPAGEVYWHELIGTPVRDLRGNDLGRVVEVYRAGGVDAYVIRGGSVEEFDLPAVREFIPVFSPGTELVVDADRLELEPARPPRPPRPVRAPKPRPAGAGGEPGPADLAAGSADGGAVAALDPATDSADPAHEG